MPIYEFRCQRCRRRSSVFTRSIGGEVKAVCSHCGSREMSRLFSKVAVLRSEGDAFGGLDESSMGDVDENDPRSMARWVRQMSRQMGEPLDAEMESELERMEAGETPDDFGDGGDDDDGFGDVD
jgi:putative FmdB family regulatory protein